MEMKIKKGRVKKKKPEVRFLYDMKDVIRDRKWLKKAPNLKVYYMYRGVREMEELRYDITVIPPKMFGNEFVKTKGNCNSNSLQEFYTVLEGNAIFLMQKMKGRDVKDIMTVRAKKGDWVIVPPEYYVISINPTKNILRLGNWVSQKNKNIYKGLEIMHGACYYYTRSGWIKNRNYKKFPKLRFKKPLRKMPRNLDLLNN